MKTLRLAAATALVSSVFALSASAAEKEWWNVDFESPTPNGKALVETGAAFGLLDVLTNLTDNGRPYTNGLWSAADSDESYVTNSYNPTNSFGSSYCLRLDTQGNDLTWTPKDPTNGVQTLVDADLYLVGSDSAPTDFDTAGDVQTAIYLKNYNDDATGDTTNSVLCVYVYNDDPEVRKSDWIELAGTNLTDQSWVHIQVKVDHSLAQPKVSIQVNNVQMHQRNDPTKIAWMVANPDSGGVALKKISSVAFRGTGAVDNFVGKTVVEEEASCTFKAEVYFDSNSNPEDQGLAGNTTRIQPAWPVGTPAVFGGFTIDDFEAGETEEQDTPATYGLTKIEIYNATGTTMITNFNYTYDETDGTATPDFDDSAYVAFSSEDNSFSVTVPTAGAPDGGDVVLAKIYFTHLNPQPAELTPVDPGQSLSAADLEAGKVPAGVVSETDDGTGVTTDYFVVNFRAPEAGVTYTLMYTTDLTLTEEQWKGTGTGAATAATGDGTATSTAAGELIELKVPISGNAAFFKIKATK